MSERITIGITDCSKYKNYHAWIEVEAGVDIIRLSYREDNAADVDKCDGIILTGGEDIHPKYYNREDYLQYCEIDEARDAFEWKVLENMERNKLPLLGICRGLQVANVFYGGSLIPHIPAVGKFDHSRYTDADRYHPVLVDRNSKLHTIVGTEMGEINSAHHQAADRVAPGLVANAVSTDGVVEGLERETTRNGPFLMLVQWHPERMNNPESAFSMNIKKSFLDAVRRERKTGS